MLSLHNVTQLLASRPPTKKGDSFLTMQPQAKVFPLPTTKGISLFLSGDLPEPTGLPACKHTCTARLGSRLPTIRGSLGAHTPTKPGFPDAAHILPKAPRHGKAGAAGHVAET